MKALPYSQQSKHIFRIGAALWLGQRDPTTETPDRIDWVVRDHFFLLPPFYIIEKVNTPSWVGATD